MLYWWETFFGSLLLAVIYTLYRRKTRGRPDAPKDGEFKAFRSKSVGNALVFTIAQAYFLGAIVVWVSQRQGTPLLPPELWQGMAGVTLLVFLNFCVDLVRLGERPFEWLKNVGGAAVGRMIVMQFTIVVGGLAFAISDRARALFIVFIGFKLLLDLAYWWRSELVLDASGRAA